MTREEIYEVWKPAGSVWSGWVKPLLFSCLPEGDLETKSPAIRTWDVERLKATAILVNLPGEDGVLVGMAVSRAQRFRPIPIYNAHPFPPLSGTMFAASQPPPVTLSRGVVVNSASIMHSLKEHTAALADLRLPTDAPPVFLVDAARAGTISSVNMEGWFDNRSFLSAADFPSAQLLRDSGTERVVLIQWGRAIDFDLERVLLAWQAAGLKIAHQLPWVEWEPVPVRVKEANWLKRFWRRLSMSGYHKTPTGFFGGWVPHGG